MRIVTKPIVWASALALATFLGSGAFGQQAQESQGQQGQGMHGEQASGQGAELGVSPATVRQIQEKLNERGYDVGPVDGNWGQKTQRAVMNFQEAQGLEATGQLNRSTLAALGVEGEGQQGQGTPGSEGSRGMPGSQGEGMEGSQGMPGSQGSERMP